MMSYKQLVLSAAAVICAAGFVVPSTAEANTVLRLGPDATVSAEQSVAGDLYLSSGVYNRTLMSGEVDGDAYMAGSDVRATGNVNGDIFVVAANTEVSASTTDDVRIVAVDVVLDGAIGGDVFIIGGSVEVLPTASIAGDLLVFAGDLSMNGVVAGSVFGAAERARINGPVDGNIELNVPAGLTLGDEAVIAGNVVFESRSGLVRSQNSVIEGEVVEQEIATGGDESNPRAVLTPLFILLFSVLSLYLLFKAQLQAMQTQLVAHPLINGGIGAGVLFAAPIVAFVFIATVLAAPLGILIFGIMGVLMLAALVLSGLTLGYYVAYTLFGADTITLPMIVGGTLLLYFMLYIPVVGILIFIATFMVTIGALVRYCMTKLA